MQKLRCIQFYTNSLHKKIFEHTPEIVGGTGSRTEVLNKPNDPVAKGNNFITGFLNRFRFNEQDYSTILQGDKLGDGLKTGSLKLLYDNMQNDFVKAILAARRIGIEAKFPSFEIAKRGNFEEKVSKLDRDIALLNPTDYGINLRNYMYAVNAEIKKWADKF